MPKERAQLNLDDDDLDLAAFQPKQKRGGEARPDPEIIKGVAEEYSELCLSEETRTRVFNMIRDEYKRTLELTLKVAQMNTLLDDNPALSVSLMRRDPYLDPLNHIQIKLLKHYRDPSISQEVRDSWLGPLLRSINAIAGGMRNTG